MIRYGAQVEVYLKTEYENYTKTDITFDCN